MLKEGHPVPIGKTAEPLDVRGKEGALDTVRYRVGGDRSQATGGTIVKLGLSSADLGTLYESKIEPLARRQHQASRLAGKAERFRLFLLTAFALLIIGCLPANRSWHWRMSWLGSARLASSIARPWTCRGGCHRLSSPRVPPTIRHRHRHRRNRRSWPWPRGGRCMTPVDSKQRLQSFEKAIERAPRSAVARFNAAAALYQLKRYTQARERYQEARLRADSVLRMKIDYALGNTSLALGEVSCGDQVLRRLPRLNRRR